MNKTTLIISIALVVALALAIAVSHAGADGGAFTNFLGTPMPVFVFCAMLAFIINWLAFIPAKIYDTEHFFDLTGSITYLVVIISAVKLSGEPTTRALLVASMVIIWAVRLGSFLFTRIQYAGKDDRFDVIKANTYRFFLTWTLQGLWVVLTAACALAIITGGNDKPIGLLGFMGIALWFIGLLIEVIADSQKSAFRKNPENQGKFIKEGLWAWSRHPNYFGEILLWIGVALLAIPVLHDWQFVTLISPVFVYVLIYHISGVKGLESKAEKRWGSDSDYQAYKASTPILIPRPPH